MTNSAAARSRATSKNANELRATPAKAHHSRKITDVHAPLNTDRPELYLVPSRWSKSGWKYVEEDPNHHRFFSNPNRMNSHGYSPRGIGCVPAAQEKQFQKVDPFKNTSYTAFFN